MSRKFKANIISSGLVFTYFIGFVLSINIVSNVSHVALLTFYIVPAFTVNFLGYDGQSDFIIWGVVLIEMLLLFLPIKWITFWFLNDPENGEVKP